MDCLDMATHYLFFAGKGGVGKTSLACATAVTLADRGRRVLLVSTDPASNLDDVLGTVLSSAQPTAVAGVPGLFARNTDPQATAAAYREHVLGLYREVLPAAELASLEEQLAGACTMEIATFDAFAELLSDAETATAFDHVVFDTAPTGHTLRLLQLPTAWTHFLEHYVADALYTGPRLGLPEHQARYATAVAVMADPQRTLLVLVTRPDDVALREAARTSTALAALGLRHQCLVVNGVFRATLRHDPVAVALEHRGQAALATLPEPLRGLPRTTVLLRPQTIVGLPALRALLGAPEAPVTPGETASAPAAPPALPTLAALVEEIAAAGHGLVMVTGKGGVGKTTIAAAMATALAARGVPVHLTTTDPAAHLTTILAAEVPGLTVSRIDPAVETQAYRQRVLEEARPRRSTEALTLLEADLHSPCTEELAVFHAFARLVSRAQRELVIMDTAPTGHTLLLLDATGAYHHELVRKFGRKVVATPLMRLRDPHYTRVVLVTLPELTPVVEAQHLQADLRRAGIEPWAWVINSSLLAAGPTDPLLRQRAAAELTQIRRVQAQGGHRVAIVPWMTEEPRGPERLLSLVHGVTRPAGAPDPPPRASGR
jgi:arsenite/tail-anchored protein-transporting ATPase